MSDDTINLTVDGKALTAKRGQMLIEVTDAAGIDVPRFCYHKKLSVAANCRMCLVEVEKAPKPLPACATPVMPDMVVRTASKVARDAQKGTMEFLLINHPLDCPICDQGGECELQDVAMGYGNGASQYTEGKRVVFDKYIGPLIATEMDRDRFSYQGLKSSDRLESPMVRIDGELQACDWPTALSAAAEAVRNVGGNENDLGVLVSPSVTVEELYLTQKLARALGTNNVDHRLGQLDFSAQESAPVMPWLGMQLNDLETLDSALLIGSNIRKDQPIAALRLRKSALKGAAISFINPRQFPLHFDADVSIATRYDRMVSELFCVARAAGADLSSMADAPTLDCDERHQQIADALKNGERSAVMLGNIAVQHPAYAQLQYLASSLAQATGATLGMLPERSNTAGAWLAGAVPHRSAGGRALAAGLSVGKTSLEMLDNPMKSYLLVGCEVEFDAARPA